VTSDAKWQTPASIEFVGTADGGTTYVIIPALRAAAIAHIHAFATGYGDPEYPGCTAFVKVAVNGTQVGAVEDANFNLYSLQIERTVTIAAKTETKIEMTNGNHLATEAGDPAHGLLVTVEAA
jgi:hypothetical protein